MASVEELLQKLRRSAECRENRDIALAAAAILDDKVEESRRGEQSGMHQFTVMALEELTANRFMPSSVAHDAQAHFEALSHEADPARRAKHLTHIRDAFEWAANGGFIGCALGDPSSWMPPRSQDSRGP